MLPHRTAADAGSEADKADLAFVRINVPKQGVSILKLRDADVTVGEILAMVQKKRALPPNQVRWARTPWVV
jgi:hypothetical protein